LERERQAAAALRRAFESEWGRIVATLIRMTGDWSLAEDCAQDAFAAAARVWPRDGVPKVPGAWLTTTARNRALDRLRRRAVEVRTLKEATAMAELEHSAEADDPEIEDDRLRLIFTCCHPALSLESRVALTLRTLCGLTVAEIARAFGVPEATMAKRLVRVRRKIQVADIPFRVPSRDRLPERLAGVLAVLYLLYTEGYAPGAGPSVVRESLSAEAIRLTRLLALLLPGDPEVLGLLALELLQDARRPARSDPDGRLVPLEEQDRRRWDADRIAEGAALVSAASALGVPPGTYLVQAMIALCHCSASAPEQTDWRRILGLYEQLARLAPSPYVELSRAVALGMAAGPDAGLAVLGELRRSGRLAGNHYLAAAEADLLRRAGRRRLAADAYRAALALVTNEAERGYLERRLSEVG
jgi:RNA polymerase sigma-70 factor (ECF subfamily)